MRPMVRQAGAVMAAGALVLGLAACGDDDDEADADTEASGVADEAGASEAFCEAVVAIDAANLGMESGESTPTDVDAALQAAVDAAPADLAEDAQLMADEAREMAAAPPSDGPPPMPSPEFYDSAVVVADRVAESCDVESIEITAADYSFEGIPDEVPAGTTLFSFDNTGTEYHEMALMRIADGEERPVEELLMLPEEEAMSLTTSTGFVMAPPDAGNYVTADLEPGRYVALCFIPVGATAEALESGAPLDGEPHMAHGMVAEFNVS